MSHDDFDDGLVHAHDWAVAAAPPPAGVHPQVADTSVLPTPSSVIHDDLIELTS